ncbi:hypothetical protein GGI25_001673 [Coemansia spiralis]|uniref:Uncharacterized protein n=2 Tax=Coemansia TaxID=4863 RepID=A0A9W8GA34_9FUNG|nr:hypothetical protein EDC05_004765 [Coemansia umbellata]KAJ2623895.1 hypothetical protein GGI26_001910 [Coemansia sp. RSA 1358]KAJ2679317.1 hypothetical protein GGI25_001673 [Coemansia spiralis]
MFEQAGRHLLIVCDGHTVYFGNISEHVVGSRSVGRPNVWEMPKKTQAMPFEIDRANQPNSESDQCVHSKDDDKASARSYVH